MPICHPDLVASGAIRKPADIKALHLLHKRGPINNWKHWGDHHDLGDINPLAGAHYDFFSMVIEAAIPGLGIGLVPR